MRTVSAGDMFVPSGFEQAPLKSSKSKSRDAISKLLGSSILAASVVLATRLNSNAEEEPAAEEAIELASWADGEGGNSTPIQDAPFSIDSVLGSAKSGGIEIATSNLPNLNIEFPIVQGTNDQVQELATGVFTQSPEVSDPIQTITLSDFDPSADTPASSVSHAFGASASVKGEDGEDGKDGADGQNGADGRDGIDGKDGVDGQNGADGRDGIDGKDGADGQNGADGRDGIDGKDGADGQNGADGRDGIDGKDGADGQNGADGRDGIDGKDGADGQNGADGRDGVDGKDGADGQNGADGQDGSDGNMMFVLEESWFEGNNLRQQITDLGVQITDGPFNTAIMSMTAEQYAAATALLEEYRQAIEAEAARQEALANLATERNDYIEGGDENDIIDGLQGDDELVGFVGADTLIGNTGNDTASYVDSDAAVNINLSVNTSTGGHAEGDRHVSIENLTGSAFGDTLIGNAQANVLIGDAGDDHLEGRTGNDTLVGGFGADHLDGGEGDGDLVSYFASNAAVNVSLLNDTAMGGHADGDRLIAIENVNGSLYDDIIQGDNFDNRLGGHHGSDQLFGEGGNDVLIGGNEGDHLDGGTGIDTADYTASLEAVNVNLETGNASGGEADGDTFVSIENLAGSYYDDVLTGDGGSNRLTGRFGNDQLFGGAGNDTLVGGEGADLLNGGTGSGDVADYSESTSGIGVDLQNGGFAGEADGDVLMGIEYIVGSDFNDEIYGDNNVNRLVGGAGDDLLFGGGGNDRFVGGQGADALDGGSGISDAADYSNSDASVVADLYYGGSGGDAAGDTYANIEFLVGSEFSDQLFGDNTHNRINGGDGDDVLQGRGGNDTLIGDAGNDTLTGGAGNDVFMFNGDEGFNTITDFEFGGGRRTDRVWLRDHEFTSVQELLDSIQQTQEGALLQNGDEFILFEGVPANELYADDFILA